MKKNTILWLKKFLFNWRLGEGERGTFPNIRNQPTTNLSERQKKLFSSKRFVRTPNVRRSTFNDSFKKLVTRLSRFCSNSKPADEKFVRTTAKLFSSKRFVRRSTFTDSFKKLVTRLSRFCSNSKKSPKSWSSTSIFDVFRRPVRRRHRHDRFGRLQLLVGKTRRNSARNA